MTPTTTTLYEQCEALFAAYPEAVRAINHDSTIHTMVLMTDSGGEPSFFILTHQDACDPRNPFFHLSPWRGTENMEIEPGTAGEIPAIADGIPLPRDGSLFGWAPGGEVTTLIAAHSQYTPESPVPSFAVMPSAAADPASWQAIVAPDLFGWWFWDYLRTGQIVNLAPAIAATSDQVLWVPSDAGPEYGAGIIAVRADVAGDGFILPQGAFRYWKALEDGIGTPPLDELLASPDATDLGPRIPIR